MNDEDGEIKALLSGERESEATKEQTHNRVDLATRKARESLAQRDTLAFALVKLWTTIAKMLAPLFAQAAKYQAQNAAHFQNDKVTFSNDGQPDNLLLTGRDKGRKS